MGKEKEIPKDILEEIKNPKFGKPESLTRTGYIPEIYDKEMKIDAQFFEAVEDGRRIVEGMNLPKKIKPSDLMKGTVYEFSIKSFKAPLSKKTIEFFTKEFGDTTDIIYQFDLTELELMDVDSDSAGEDESEDE
ncbi:MAG: hypothetical protein WBV92_02295 [Nitrosotalea sp.]